MKRVTIPSDIEVLAHEAVDSALAVHRAFGPGLLESAYRDCLARELETRGLLVERELALPITYRGRVVPRAFRTDILLEKKLLLELKAVESVLPVHRVQLQTYLQLLHLPLGLLVNFHTPLIKDGIHRVLNLEFQTEVSPAPDMADFGVPSRLCV